MALSANTVWEVRTAGSDVAGGGFVSGASGTDYSQQDAKNTVGNNISTTDAVAIGTTTITSATASFTSAIVGNIVYFAGGTGSITGVWRQVATFTNSTTIVLDAAIAASTGMTMNIGGALASPGQASASIVASNTVYVKAGTYTITSATQSISGGCVKLNMAGNPIQFVGYSTVRGDNGRPTFILGAGVSTATVFTALCYLSLSNLILDGNNQTASSGYNGGSANQSILSNVLAQNFTATGLLGGNVIHTFLKCSATGNSAVGFSGQFSLAVGCEAYGNTASGFSQINCLNCLSYGNTGASSDGFSTAQSTINCIAYGNGRDGFRSGGAMQGANCYAEGNAGKGIGLNRLTDTLLNCFTFNNTGGSTTTVTGALFQTVTALSSSGFVNAASSNFALNSTVGGGASLRATGYPGVFPRGLTTGYIDIGAAQHQDTPSTTTNIFPIFD